MYDVVIAGGSFAGCACALFLGNALRRVAVIDNGRHRNRFAPRAYNVPGYEKMPPGEILQKMQAETARFKSIIRFQDTAVSVDGDDREGFAVQLVSGEVVCGRKVVLATGTEDVPPDLPGMDTVYPDFIFPCPYCIAYDLQDQPLAVYAPAVQALEMGLIIQKWTRDLIVLTGGADPLSSAEKARLEDKGIRYCTTAITRLDREDETCMTISLADGSSLKRRGVFIHMPFRHKGIELIRSAGCRLSADNLVITDDNGETTVPGIYAAGDAAGRIQKISPALAGGVCAGFAIDHALSLMQTSLTQTMR